LLNNWMRGEPGRVHHPSLLWSFGRRAAIQEQKRGCPPKL